MYLKVLLILCFVVYTSGQDYVLVKSVKSYYGNIIDGFSNTSHGVKGVVYARNQNTLLIEGFSYDGTAKNVVFWAGFSDTPSSQGYVIPYPERKNNKEEAALKTYNETRIILRLPQGMDIKGFRSLSVWDLNSMTSFGEVIIPANLTVPKHRVLPKFKEYAHGLKSGDITILDAKTFYITNLYYDGGGPDAYFWVGTGKEPTVSGIRVPNEVGSLKPLKGYTGENITIQLPGRLTVYDIEWLGMWCVQFKQNFGHVVIPKDLFVPPVSSSNCHELLDKRLQVTWHIQNDAIHITLSSKIRDGQYMAFGISGAHGRAKMIGSDVTVAFYDPNNNMFNAVDYNMSDYAQCDGNKGVCPDERVGGTNNVQLLSGNRKNGVTRITFMRPLEANDPDDKSIRLDGSTTVIAAFGPLNVRKEANAHISRDKSKEDVRIDFTKNDDYQCTTRLEDEPNFTPSKVWTAAKIRGEKKFTARIGQSGSSRGYSFITGYPSWGIAWYINELLVPELYLERGETYQFIVEGGNDKTNTAHYHPFYITTSPEGGLEQKKNNQNNEEKVYAGAKKNAEGKWVPTLVGRYCEYTHESVDQSAVKDTFEEFFKTLKLKCDVGDPAVLNWTVPYDAPNVLYYQCFSHSNLGWKINILGKSTASQTSRAWTNFVINGLIVLSIAITFVAQKV